MDQKNLLIMIERGYLYKNYDLNSLESKFSEFMNDRKKTIEKN